MLNYSAVPAALLPLITCPAQPLDSTYNVDHDDPGMVFFISILELLLAPCSTLKFSTVNDGATSIFNDVAVGVIITSLPFSNDLTVVPFNKENCQLISPSWNVSEFCRSFN